MTPQHAERGHGLAALIQADVLTWLRERQWLAQNGYWPRYHAVFADPPYGLEFMGQEWDKPKASNAKLRTRNMNYAAARTVAIEAYVAGYSYQAWVTEWARLLLDFVYPGAVLLMFGSPRTYHRLATGLEDAGWEVFDSLMFLHGQGFPKSHNLSKALDKEAGAEREVIDYVRAGFGNRNGKTDEEGGIFQNSLPEELKRVAITAPATVAARQWDGYGTALKPAFEPLVMARRPRGNHTYAALAQQYGTGALNIAGGRIGTDNNLVRPHILRDDNQVFSKGLGAGIQDNPLGRWPSNLLLAHAAECTDTACTPDCPVRILGEQSGETDSGARPAVRNVSHFASGKGTQDNERIEYPSGTAARFYYTAKAASWEREAGLSKRSTHPTVKPIQLNEYMARLILPPPLSEPRRILIPFAGVASEMIGAQLAGWDEITGIEQSVEYVAQGNARLAWWGKYATYEKAQEAYQSQQEGAKQDAEREQAGQLALPLFAQVEGKAV